MAFIGQYTGAADMASFAANPSFPEFPSAVSTALETVSSIPLQSTIFNPAFLATKEVPDLLTIASTFVLVTASDMIPFVPCQPLAITLGATLGLWAFPICVLGQSLAGVLAFQSARAIADAEGVQKVLDGLGEEAREKFDQFKKMGTKEKEETVFLALIGLRLAPFFPFSAGNYLLGGATGVGLRPFFLATLLGCLLSNFLSVSIGVGGMELLQNSP